MDWKIKRDPFYCDLYEKYGLDYIRSAGFFDTDNDNPDIDESLNVMCTPIGGVKENIRTKKNPAILYMTGSLCPIHHGHIEVINSASLRMQELGHDGITIYIGPDHDSYISRKNGPGAIPIWERIRLIHEAIKHIPDAHVDPWPGVFNKSDINFTEAVERISRYVKKWTGANVPVYFLCGGDNAGFARTFVLKGQCIVVGRGQYVDEFNRVRDELAGHKNIHFVEGFSKMSSTSIRKDWVEPNSKQLILRYSKSHQTSMADTVLDNLKDNFSFVQMNDCSTQRVQLRSLPAMTLNLDAISDKDMDDNLRVSRCYDLGGVSSLGFVNRPGSDELEYQLRRLSGKKYYLFDDDIHSGSTMDFVEALLNENDIRVMGRLSLTRSSSPDVEILDLRDFLPYEDESGLVVRLPDGNTSRVPYMYPYVDPYVRGSIRNPLHFSLRMWNIWAAIFRDSDETLDAYGYDVFKLIGFDDKSLMSDIVAWHQELLQKYK